MDSQVTLVNGQVATMSLAERGTPLSNGLWLREIRRLNPDGHQTAIITTDYGCDFRRLAVNMMARWSQENFFKYAREHYGLDRLAGYCTQDVPDPKEHRQSGLPRPRWSGAQCQRQTQQIDGRVRCIEYAADD